MSLIHGMSPATVMLFPTVIYLDVIDLRICTMDDTIHEHMR
jgi:hypothetical protein